MRQPMSGPMLLAIAALAALTTIGAPASAATAALAAPNATAASAPASGAMPEHSPMVADQRHKPKVVEHYVDINSAGRKELMTLPGIGRAEADKIIAHRPYLSKTELVTKGVLATGPYLSLRYQVVAMQKLPLETKKATKAPGAKASGTQASGRPASGPKTP